MLLLTIHKKQFASECSQDVRQRKNCPKCCCYKRIVVVIIKHILISKRRWWRRIWLTGDSKQTGRSEGSNQIAKIKIKLILNFFEFNGDERLSFLRNRFCNPCQSINRLQGHSKLYQRTGPPCGAFRRQALENKFILLKLILFIMSLNFSSFQRNRGKTHILSIKTSPMISFIRSYIIWAI